MARQQGLRLALRSILLAAILLAFMFDRPTANAANEAQPVKKFHLYATDGYVTLPDGKSIYVWGYSLADEPGTAVFPAPPIEANEGDAVEITLTNIGPKKSGIKRLAHTIHFHGLDTDQANDGVPHTSQAIQVGESFTYKFTASHAGTYFYHCHVDTVEHLQMGMYGAFVVKAKGGANQAWTGGPVYDKDYVFLLNEIDPVWHQAVEEGKAYDRTNYQPRYWTINGKAYPDTEEDPTASISGEVGEKVLIRMINAGYQSHSFHMHGYHFQVIASDGRPLPEPLTKDTILIGPGERYDLLVTFDQAGSFPFHSHNIVDNTNDGAYPGGLHTMIDVTDPSSEASPSMTMTLRFKLGSTSVVVNGKTVAMKAAPITIGGTTYVPPDFLAEQLGATVAWNAGKKVVTLTKARMTLRLAENDAQASIDGRLVFLPAAPKKIKGALMVPLRFVSETFGATMLFDRGKGEIVVTGTMKIGSSEAGHEHGTNSSGTDPIATPITKQPGEADGNPNSLTLLIDKAAFMPKKLTIRKGQTVTWINRDSMSHTVYDLGDSFSSRDLPPNQSYSHLFDQTGTYTYYCSIHPSMVAEIEVVE
ncbi:multicopper oxidase domain-containing protein [Cohnella mopanensis]|uniref:multicopper oxidase domain-containing protein n=1 Tax=Cohnella mopanensis TaxID=2911966 RepID=UPI001EF9744A|nr:stalk domain-containing protein [Cohnella mopanensis]